MKKTLIGIVSAATGLLLSVMPVAAHVVVSPREVGVGASQLFTVGVPNEETSDTISVRVVIPDGVEQVTPQVKPGWTITEKKTGDADTVKITEITWSGGVIPPGQRDEFSFSAQVPGTEQTLYWKAYQSYQDGNIISWDKSPTGTASESRTPYSMTIVVNDIANAAAAVKSQHFESRSDTVWQALTMLSLILSVLSLGMQFRRKA